MLRIRPLIWGLCLATTTLATVARAQACYAHTNCSTNNLANYTFINGNSGSSAFGVAAYSSGGNAVDARSYYSNGVQGVSTSSVASGVYGENMHSGNGVAGRSNANGSAVLGDNTCTGLGCTGYSGLFTGRVHASDDLSTSGTKPFRIDHPQDPANRILMHAAIESPEVLNSYSGVVRLDKSGNATVRLPSYFSTLNKGEYRYQLTCIGAFAPVYVSREVTEANEFSISGGSSELRVSWEIRAVRNDARMRARPFVPEQDKAISERGFYLDPSSHGMPKERGVIWSKKNSP